MVDFDLRSANARLRAGHPLIQCITNTVVQQFSANVLLAVGASPAMLDHEADAGQFAGIANGVLINFGTASNHQLLAADAAIDVAAAAGKPWVLDPVSVGAVDFRTSRIRRAAPFERAYHVAPIAGWPQFMPLVIGTGWSLGAGAVAYLVGAGKGTAGPDSDVSVPAAAASADPGAPASARFEAVVAAHAHFA